MAEQAKRFKLDPSDLEIEKGYTGQNKPNGNGEHWAKVVHSPTGLVGRGSDPSRPALALQAAMKRVEELVSGAERDEERERPTQLDSVVNDLILARNCVRYLRDIYAAMQDGETDQVIVTKRQIETLFGDG